jgi:hypothetical protein
MEEDILDKYRATTKLYANMKKYLDTKNITKDTPFPIVAVKINLCLRRYKAKEKPSVKVLHLIFYYLDSIGYKF